MSSRTLPRYLVLTATLSLVVGGLLLTVFYGQYRLITGQLIDNGTQQFNELQVASFERRARSRLHRIADAIVTHEVASADSDVGAILESGVTGDADIVSIRFTGRADQIVTAGDLDWEAIDDTLDQSNRLLYVTYPVENGSVALGSITGAFDVSSVGRETGDFRQGLESQYEDRRSAALVRILGTVLLCVLLVGTVIYLVVGNQSRRIEEVQTQARKLSHANFGEPLVVESSDDIGELARVFNEMRDELQRTTVSRDYMDKILSGMNEAIIVTDADGTITRVNDATTRMLGYDPEDVVGSPVENILDSTRSGTLQTSSEGGIPDEALLTSKFGESIPVSYTGSVIEQSGANTVIYAAQNISERRKAEQRIRYLARIDALTKVPNRMQFQHLLQRAIARAKRSGHSLALFYIDVDYFKEINDTFGHLAGDTTLETVANRLQETLPEDCIIGRLAGDEFAVIVDRLKAGESTVKNLDGLARNLLNRLAEPFYVQGHEVFMTASLGIACYPSDAENVIDLIRNADAALYHSKKNGGNLSAHYHPEMNHTAVERLMTKSKLKRAFERDELLVRYQPRYNIETGEVVGAEALVRWDLPERGIILPADFIPLAEETNLIIEIGEWVLDRVCEDFRYWQGSVASPGRISVNLSLKQLRQMNFIQRISGILRSYELSPTSLELEITETTLMENPVRTVKLLNELYSLGLHLAIDDFGTGYSSLSALQQFPISTLKIDKSFVRDVAISADDATIVGTIIQMGKSLNMEVVAEGVESEDQLGFLQNLGCAFVQGLLFGEPMSSDDYLDLMLSQAEGTDKYRALFA